MPDEKTPEFEGPIERMSSGWNRSKGKQPSLKVSERGAVSLYGLGRFPVTLDKEQWERLLSIADEIRAFMAEHEDQLKPSASSEPTSVRGSADPSSFTIGFSPELSVEQIIGSLRALADYYRACGGAGLTIEFEEAPVSVPERSLV